MGAAQKLANNLLFPPLPRRVIVLSGWVFRVIYWMTRRSYLMVLHAFQTEPLSAVKAVLATRNVQHFRSNFAALFFCINSGARLPKWLKIRNGLWATNVHYYIYDEAIHVTQPRRSPCGTSWTFIKELLYGFLFQIATIVKYKQLTPQLKKIIIVLRQRMLTSQLVNFSINEIDIE